MLFRSDSGSIAKTQRTFSGTLQPRYQSALGFRVPGKIIERHVEAGEKVNKGQVLYRLDPTDYDLQLQVAESDLAAAKSILLQVEAEERRLADLRLSKSTSQSDYELAVAARDTARARLSAAENRLLLAKNQCSYAELVADQDGLVTRIMAEIGQVVAAGQPVVHWVQGNELEAVVSIPESMQKLIKEVQAGQLTGSVQFWSRPGCTVQASLREVSPVADPISRTYDARFRLIDPPNDLALGMTASVSLPCDETQGIPVPMGAIAQYESGQSSAVQAPVVWRIDREGHVEPIPVGIVKYGADRAWVSGPLKPGEQIVGAGVQRIDPQCRVRIWRDSL